MAATHEDRNAQLSPGVAIKAPCRLATTANITLNGEQTIDGIAAVTGDRVFVKNQTDTTANGLYTVSTGSWTREPDFDGTRDVVEGTIISVNQGATNSDTMWRVTNTGTIVFGTTTLTFERALVNDSATITFLQSGAGAVARSVQSKGRDVVSAKDDGATGDGVTNDRAAVLSVQTDFPTTLIHVPAGTYLFSTAATLSGNFLFYAGAKLKPASGVTITVTGSIMAGMYQIFDTSAGGHVDCTSAKIDFAPVEWWGATGGDAAFSSGNAAINKPLIDEAILYCWPHDLHFKQPGIYSTTGHVLSGTSAGKIVGAGCSTYRSDGVANKIVGSGIAFSDASNMGTDPAKFLNYIFQNGAVNNGQMILEDIQVEASNYLTVCPIACLASTIAQLSSTLDLHRVTSRGYFGLHLSLNYSGSHRDCNFVGNGLTVNGSFTSGSGGAAIALTTPGIVQPDANTGTVVRTHFAHCTAAMTSSTSGQLLYQKASNKVFINANLWTATAFVGPCYDGFVLDSSFQTFNTCEVEQIGHTVVTETVGSSSLWLNTYASSNQTALRTGLARGSMYQLGQNLQVPNGVLFLGSSNPAVSTTVGYPSVTSIGGIPTGDVSATLSGGEAPVAYDRQNFRPWYYVLGSGWMIGTLWGQTPNTQTGATYTVLPQDVSIIANRAGTVTLTLETASTVTGKMLIVRTIQAQTVVSAGSNVVPLVGGAAGTAILAATAGKWALLHSDGTNWTIMMGN